MALPFAVVFDMDGVIADTNPFHKDAIQQFVTKYGFELTEDELKTRVYGTTNRQWITNLFGELTEDELQAYAFEKEQLFRDIYAPYINPVKGLTQFLDLLVEHQIPRSIATSAPPANVDFVLDRTGTRKYFDIILDERMVTQGKPNPEIYLKSAKVLGLPNQQCIVIEDSLAGVAAARKSGSKVIGITTTHSPAELQETDLVIDDFDQLTIGMLRNLANDF